MSSLKNCNPVFFHLHLKSSIYFLKWLLIPFIITFTISPVKSQTLEVVKSQTISSIRSFRDVTNKFNIENSSAVDSLQKTISTIIYLTKTLNDTEQLNVISNYFAIQKSIISDYKLMKSEDEIESVSRNINQDILYKINYYQDSSLNLQGAFNFGEEREITVTAYIDGKKQDTGLYRIYWAYFRGRSTDTLISHKSFAGSSNNFTNPYKLKIILPCSLITFWMIDTRTNFIYKPDIPFKELKDINSPIDISFKKY